MNLYIIIGIVIGLMSLALTLFLLYNKPKREFDVWDTVIAMIMGILCGVGWPAALVCAALCAALYAIAIGLTALANRVVAHFRNQKVQEEENERVIRARNMIRNQK